MTDIVPSRLSGRCRYGERICQVSDVARNGFEVFRASRGTIKEKPQHGRMRSFPSVVGRSRHCVRLHAKTVAIVCGRERRLVDGVSSSLRRICRAQTNLAAKQMKTETVTTIVPALLATQPFPNLRRVLARSPHGPRTLFLSRLPSGRKDDL